MSETPEEKKIIVDEDWKSQVDAEREALEKEELPATEQQQTSEEEQGPLPQASFTTLVTTLASQAMGTLGQFPDPASGQPTVQLDYAKHFIDTLSMLQEKTAGNLSQEEAAMLENVVHQLQMVFVEINRQNSGEELGS